jgi:hypothetical protein
MTQDEGRGQPPPGDDQPPPAPPPAHQPPAYGPPPDPGGYAPPGQGGYGPPPGQPPPYGPPPPGYPPPSGYPPPYPQPAPPNNGLAVASLVMGIAGLTFFPIVASIGAIISGFISKNQIDQSNGAEGGRGMATAGIVTGFIGIVLWVLFIVVFVLLLGIFNEVAEDIDFEQLFSPTPTLTF